MANKTVTKKAPAKKKPAKKSSGKSGDVIKVGAPGVMPTDKEKSKKK